MNNLDNFKILDCTIRDGGYYTNWDFDRELVNTYLTSMNHLPVEYLEIGYRSPKLEGYYGEFFYCPTFVLERIKMLSNKKLVIILNEKDIKPSIVRDLLLPCVGIISMVRIAIDPQNLSRALLIAEKIKEVGFEVGFNVMYMSKWKTQPDFIQELKHVDGIADYFYMVDSYGGVYPNDVKEIYSLVRSETTTKIGFHGHNNLELGLINSLTALECGAEIIDATVTGMGRGAGNLKTELLLTALNQSQDLDVDFNALASVTDVFTTLQKKHEWGTNLPYMVSGANSLPQKEVMEWTAKRYYSINSIIRALNNQKNKIKDNLQYPKFHAENKIDTAFIIGGGSSAIQDAEAVIKIIQLLGDNICIIHASSKNSLPYASLEVEHYYCLVGNEGNRFVSVLNANTDFRGNCILPAYPRRMGTFVPEKVHNKTVELEQVEFTHVIKDSHTALAIQTAINLGVKTCYIVGYDGYVNMSMSNKEQELFIENEQLFADAKLAGLYLEAITATSYKNIISGSVYSKF